MLEFLRVIGYSLISVAALFVLTRLLGNRQMSQLTMFDYVIGISIGSIAADIAANPEDKTGMALLAMATYALMALLISIINAKSIKIRKLVLGAPIVLYDSGTLYYNSLKKSHLDLTEFLTSCRSSGYFDLSKLQMVIMEVNGQLSFLPLPESRPLTPADMDLLPPKERPVITVIMDGAVLDKSLRATGNDQAWLMKQLHLQGFTDAQDILMATVDANNTLVLYEKNEDKISRNYFP